MSKEIRTIEVLRQKLNSIKDKLCVGSTWLDLSLLLVLGILHFHPSFVFSRDLIQYDDHTFIEPLHGMSLRAYVYDWLLKPGHYGFPLRDLTFAFDFTLSDLLGVKTFWITQFILYSALLWILSKIIRLLIPEAKKVERFFILSLIALHPIHVEIIEWVSNRKHLLVALLLSVGTYRVLKTWLSQQSPTRLDWLIYFGLYCAAWLCWPTANLWIFWVLFVFRKDLLASKTKGAILTASAVILNLSAIQFVTHLNTEYVKDAEAVASLNVLSLALNLGLQAVGRGTFNLLFPIQIVAYSRIYHPFNWMGLLLFLGIGVWFLRQLIIQKGTKREVALVLFILAGCLFAPQFMVVLGHTNFDWADRYLFSSFPYVFLGCYLLSDSGLLKKGMQVGLIGLLIFYLCVDWKMVPSWETEVTLYNRCALLERSPKCVLNTIQQGYNRYGCATLGPFFSMARELEKNGITEYDVHFRLEVPLHESICIVDMLIPPSEKLKQLQETRQIYQKNYFTVGAEIILYLQQKDFSRAYDLATKTYLNPSLTISDALPKGTSLLRGQGEALCILQELITKKKDCRPLLAGFQDRVKAVNVELGTVTWGANRTLKAYTEGR